MGLEFFIINQRQCDGTSVKIRITTNNFDTDMSVHCMRIFMRIITLFSEEFWYDIFMKQQGIIHATIVGKC